MSDARQGNPDCDEYYAALEAKEARRDKRKERRQFCELVAGQCKVRFVVTSSGGGTFDPKLPRLYENIGRKPLETKTR